MWLKEIFGTDIYHLVSAFIIYSMLGWLVESIYMSICNKKLTNRGFTFLPFCPIYGFGAVIGNLVLSPLNEYPVALYLIGAIVATVFEFLVGMLMIRLFGELWWDYNDKPLNFKGIICLESTIAWGFYALGIVFFLNNWVNYFIDKYSYSFGTMMCRVILFVVTIDFIYHLFVALGVNIKEYRDKAKEKCQAFIARWY